MIASMYNDNDDDDDITIPCGQFLAGLSSEHTLGFAHGIG